MPDLFKISLRAFKRSLIWDSICLEPLRFSSGLDLLKQMQRLEWNKVKCNSGLSNLKKHVEITFSMKTIYLIPSTFKNNQQ